tara:strand:- start:40 stop:591 length:552 start_codon:yes stop_codon:yes gene_type:complete
MKFTRLSIPEVILIEPVQYGDNRGYFIETFRKDLFDKEVGEEVKFIQDNESKSVKGVLRGLHFQIPPFAQSKLVRVVEGSVLDVAVDIRSDSLTFGQHVSIILSADKKNQLFIPQGFAHGFVTLSDSAIFSYKTDNYYSPDHERSIAFDDADLSIDWKFPKKDLKLSLKDKQSASFSELNTLF